MSRAILIYGQPAAGKSYALRNLDPATTFIVDADSKGALPWRGWKKSFNPASKNFVTLDELEKIHKTILKIGTAEKFSHIKTLVIDGLNSAMSMAEIFHPDRSYNKWVDLAQKILSIAQSAKNQRNDLNIIITAHVDCADPSVENSIDKIKTPGKQIERINFESLFLYVFYAKCDGDNYYFETRPNKSSARTPADLFPPQIPNDVSALIDEIERYEQGE